MSRISVSCVAPRLERFFRQSGIICSASGSGEAGHVQQPSEVAARDAPPQLVGELFFIQIGIEPMRLLDRLLTCETEEFFR